MRQRTVQQKKDNISASDIAKTYNELKTSRAKQYTGMKVGRSHKWYYDKGE
jgi:hypothetical protein